jgi:hypothetical protein
VRLIAIVVVHAALLAGSSRQFAGPSDRIRSASLTEKRKNRRLRIPCRFSTARSTMRTQDQALRPLDLRATIVIACHSTLMDRSTREGTDDSNEIEIYAGEAKCHVCLKGVAHAGKSAVDKECLLVLGNRHQVHEDGN